MKLFDLPNSNGRYKIDAETGRLFSMVYPGYKNRPTVLEANYAGDYQITQSKGDWRTTTVRKSYIQKLVAEFNNKTVASAAPDTSKDGRFYVIVDNEIFTDNNGDNEFDYDDAVKAAEEALDEGYYDDIIIAKKVFDVEKTVKANLIPA